MKYFLLGGILCSWSMFTFALDSGLASADTPSKESRALTLSSDAGGVNYCGDGITRNGEQCDDGNYLNGDGCDSNCNIEIQSMAINEKGLPGSAPTCPKGCRWNRWVNDCRCAQGVARTAPSTDTGVVRESPSLLLRESPSRPSTKRLTLFIDDVSPMEVTSPRDSASGQASGKRSSSATGVGPDMEPDIEALYTGPCKPPYLCDYVDIMRSKEDVYVWKITSPRDAASGQASGKRQHGTVKIVKERDKSTPLLGRGTTGEPNTGSSGTNLQNFVYPILPAWTGRLEEIPVDDDITMGMRKSKPAFFDVFVDDGVMSERKGRDGSVKGGVASPRDAASGQATGKRQHKPYRIVLQESQDCDDEVCDLVFSPVIEADLDGDGIFETHLSLNGLPPGESLRVINRSMWDLATGKK